ncbi:MAG: restriction endonuclease subunit S [Spirochaetes bacterium]|nr:MAG: restriction endonuclease subunit S [Spirochaetota bacterium]RKX93826.1 MAG: restriction endonuclease subunit S [Spirochaetota bacterium]
MSISTSDLEYYSSIFFIPKGWRFHYLEALSNGIFDCPHSTPKFTVKGYHIVRTPDIIKGKLNTANTLKVSEASYIDRIKRAEPKTGDILLSREGTYFGIAAVIPDNTKLCLGQRMVLIRPDDDQESEYIRFWINSPIMQLFIHGYRDGSVAERLNMSTIRKLPILLPPLPEQKAIASVLSSLDDKIDLLHRQNKTLESMAETLFRQWFVEEADESWEIERLGEATDIAIGRTPPRKEFHWFSDNPKNFKWISIKDLGNDGIFISKTAEFLTQEAVKQFKIPIIPVDTVVLSFKMTVGRVAITTEDMLSNEAIAQFKIKPETSFSKEYLFLFLKTYRYDSLGSTSSIVTAINSRMIKEIEIPLPDVVSMRKFGKVTEAIFEKIKLNQQQVQILENCRNILLPKLISGKIRVWYE